MDSHLSQIASCVLCVFLFSCLTVSVLLCEKKLNEDSMVKSQLDVKTPRHSVSGRSYITSTPESSNVAVFEVGMHFFQGVCDKSGGIIG